MKRLIQWLRDRLPVPRSSADALAREVAKWIQINNLSDRKIRQLENDLDRMEAQSKKIVSDALDSMKATYEKSLKTERDALDRFKIAHSRLAGATRAPFEAREAALSPPFDDDDRTRWREFLATPTGRRLAQGLNWWAQYKEQQATLTTTNQAWHCGEAAGYRAFGVWALHSLSADTRLQQGEDTRAQNGASDLRERIAP